MIDRWLSPYKEHVFTVARIVWGLSLTCHGLQKIFGFLGAQTAPVGSQFWVGGLIELVSGTLVAVGFLTSWAAFLASGMLAVAYMQFHWQFQMGANFFPIQNKGELAVAYCFVFLYIACRGAGPWSVDAKLQANRASS